MKSNKDTNIKKAERSIQIFKFCRFLLLGASVLSLVLFEWDMFNTQSRLILTLLSAMLMICNYHCFYFGKKYLGNLFPVFAVLMPGTIGLSLFYFVYSQNINMSYHWFLLIWLCGLVPSFFVTRSKIATTISFFLFFAWATIFFEFYSYGGMIFKLLSLLCFCGFVFGLSSLADQNPKMQFFSKTWGALSFLLSSMIFGVLSINVFDNHNFFDITSYIYNSFYGHGIFLLLFYLITLGILIYNLVSRTLALKKLYWEGLISFLALAIPTVAYLFIDNYFVTNLPGYYSVAYDNAIWALFNGVAILFLLSILMLGVFRKQKILIVTGLVLTIMFAFTKYFNAYLQKIELWQKYFLT